MDDTNSRIRAGKLAIHRGKIALTAEEQRVMTYVLGNEQLRNISTKLVEDKNRNSGTTAESVPTQAVIALSSKISNEINDIRAIERSLPEVETARDILTASILSPHDAITEELVWSLNGEFPADLGNRMLNVVKEHFENDLNINERLERYIGNALFSRGSHILAVLPESSIDDIINGRTQASLESYHISPSGSSSLFGMGALQRYHLQSQRDKRVLPIALESFGYATVSHSIIPGLLSVTDNIEWLKMPLLNRKKMSQQITKRYYQPSLESISLNLDMDEESVQSLPVNQFYREVVRRRDGHIAVMNDRFGSSRKSIGHPLLLEPPHECCIPVFTPGEPEDHLGYFFLLDENGNFITYLSETDNLSQLGNHTQANGNLHIKETGVFSQTLNELSNLFVGKNCECNKMTIDELSAFYGRMIERDLQYRFSEMTYGSKIQINAPLEIYRVMLARALAGSGTQLLYLPASLVTYIAFYHNDFGVGESLVTRTKQLAGMRIGTMYANAVAMSKNAVGKRQLKITLDPDTQDGEERVSQIVADHIENNSNQQLFHTYDPEGILKSLYASSVEVLVDGNDAMDQTQVEVNYKSGDRPLIDNEYMESSKRQFIDALHIPSKLFDDSAEVQFSSEFTTNNILYMKRNRKRAITFNRFMLDFVIKYTLNDGELISEMSKMIRDDFMTLDQELINEAKEAKTTIPIIEAFFRALEVGVPLPELRGEASTGKAFDDYMQKVEKYVGHLVESQMMEYFVSETDAQKKQEAIRQLMELIKHLFAEDWIKRNNAFPEFDDLFYIDGEFNVELLKGILDKKSDLANNIGELFNQYFERANPPDGEEGGGDTTASEPTPTASGEGDEFNTEEEPSTDDTSTDDTSTEEETSDDTPEEENNDENENTEPADGKEGGEDDLDKLSQQL